MNCWRRGNELTTTDAPNSSACRSCEQALRSIPKADPLISPVRASAGAVKGWTNGLPTIPGMYLYRIHAVTARVSFVYVGRSATEDLIAIGDVSDWKWEALSRWSTCGAWKGPLTAVDAEWVLDVKAWYENAEVSGVRG